MPSPTTLSGTRFLFAELAAGIQHALNYALQIAMAMGLMRALVRNQWLTAIIIATCFLVAWHYQAIVDAWYDKPGAAQWALGVVAYYGVAVVLLARQGVLATSAFMLCHNLFRSFPWDIDGRGPDLPGTVFAVAAILVCVFYGFYTSVGGRAAIVARLR